MAPLFAVKEAVAFSLGQIRVIGAPNKEFKVEIPVRVDGKPGLNVSLGDAVDYKRIGVPRPVFIDGLILKVAPHPDAKDQSILYITSAKPLLLPSFNLVVKASLGGGTILKNYFLALDFQKNLNLDLPVTAEERSEMEKIAKELKKLKPGEEIKEPAPAETDEVAMIEKIKKQEKEATLAEGQIQSKDITEPAPADEVRPIKVSPPKPATREPEAVETDEVAMIERIKKQEKEATLAEGRIEAETATKPEPEKSIIKPSPERPPIMEGQVVGISADPAANVYEVKKGDTLYKIAKKLGVSSKDYDRVVVALWRDNSRHFIKGNIHGLYSGRKLDFSRVNETASNISRAEAKQIIKDQWPLWQSRAAADSAKAMETSKPLIGIKAPAVKLPFKSEILSALTGWRQSLEKGDMAVLMEYYSDNFKSGEILKHDLRGVKFDDVKMTENDGVIEVILPAPKGSDNKMPKSPGKLYFAIENGRYRIVNETGGGAPSPVSDAKKENHPFILHIASFKKQESAQKLVELLRQKGYNAFVVLSFVPGKGSWHRVAVGRFASVSGADMFSKTFKKNGLSRYTRTLKLPYAIRIGDIVSSEKVEAKIEGYLDKGFSTYDIKEGLNGKASIFLGAFDSEKSATRALALLGELKDLSSVVKP
ncbi:hypothetical protein MNBD_NITROSPINAE04-2370 [hydrothermal vent metagenome]|uniref:LysM domain-containing protein n=1 Tax=hydrothermal vent metagenome TaxID=652676 RepID=A0A3B1BV00_9ZZZZ